MTRWRRLVRAPALHFVVLGGLLFALHPSLPRAVERGAGVTRTDEEMLLDEALALGLDHNDRFVRARLAGLARLADAGGVEDAAGLDRTARRLGLERHDLVVRRHLVQMMELALAHGGSREVPEDATLAAYLDRHRDRFVEPMRLRFSHVFFARDRAGTPAAAAAEAALARLASQPMGLPAPAGMGDGFLDGPEIAGSAPQLARAFGPAFVDTVAGFPIGRWAGPVHTAYGWHVVRVDERVPAAMPTLAAVRSRVVQAVLAERAAGRLERRLAERRAHDRAG
jgi:peptidyl-prolyl cis-trans isomerase C